MGIFGGSRPVYNPSDGYYYVMVHLEAYPKINPIQDWGVGVIRTQTLDNPDSWRGWDGSGFNVQFVDPYNETVTNPEDHYLQPVSQENIGKMCESLTYNTYFEKFMVVGFHNKRNINTNETIHGIYYSLSDDLINWSSPVLVYESPKTGWEVGGIYYPAIIDHSDTTRNFQRPGQDAYLYFTKWNSGSYDRDLVRVPIRFHKNIVSEFTVNSTGDLAGKNIGTGTGYTGGTNSAGDPEVTLRSAMHEVLASPDPDYVFTIGFDIPGDGPHIINVGSFFPEPDRPLIIDGYTQTGASANTNALDQGNNAVIKIELDGSASGGAVGFNLYSRDIIIKGLAIHGFGSGIQINDVGSCTVQGCYIGTDASGAALGDEIGITIVNATHNLIGGTDPAQYNVITGEVIIDEGSVYNEVRGNYVGLDATGANTVGSGGISIRNAANNIIDANVSSGTYRGLEIRGALAQNNVITNNFFGTDRTGVNGMSSGLIGIYISDKASSNFIGTAGNGNVISSWQYRGVVIDSSDNNKVQANWIGTDQSAVADIGNLNEAVHIINTASGNMIGGEVSGEGNIIAYNDGVAVRIGAESDNDLAGTGNAVLGNQIFHNGYGIDIDPTGINENDALDADTGPNNLQNAPVLTYVNIGSGDTHIQGTLETTANTTCRIEFFANDGLDANGLGQVQEFIGSKSLTTDANGQADIDVHLALEIQPGCYVTATATDADYNTSEFSNPFRATSDIYFPDIDVSPLTLDFSVNPTQMLDDNITITNTGNLSLDWSALTSAPWIRLDQGSGTLNSSTSTLLNVTVEPQNMQAGTHNDIIYIISTDPDEDTLEVAVSMTINGYAEASVSPASLAITVAPDSIGSDSLFIENTGTTLLEYYLHTSHEYISLTPSWGHVSAGATDTVIVTADVDTLDLGSYSGWIRVDPVSDQQSITIPLDLNVAIEGPYLSLSQTSISAVLEQNSSTNVEIIISNPGSELLTWSAYCNDPWVIPVPDTTSIPSGAADTMIVSLDVTGMALGRFTTNLWIESNDPNNALVGIPVSISIVEPGPRMSIAPESFDITIKAHEIYQDSIWITNNGTEVLHWSGIPSVDWISITPDTSDIQPGSTAAVLINIDAHDQAEQIHYQSVGFTSNAVDNSSIVLSLSVNVVIEPEITVLPDTVFKTLAEGETGTATFTIYNDGSENLDNLSVGNSFESNWLNPSPKNPPALVPGDSVMITVDINGSVLSLGEHEGLCFVNSNDPDEPVVEIPFVVTISEQILPPEIVITNPVNHIVLDTTALTVDYEVHNFNVASPGNGDGYVQFQRDEYPVRTRYEVSSLSFSDLSEGEHMVRIWLVDNNGNALDPMVADTLFFAVRIPAPAIVVIPDVLEYSLLAGSTHSDTIMIHNLGDAELSWSLGNQTTWLNYNLAAGLTAASDSTELILTINTGPLSATYYVDTLTFMSNDPDIPFLDVPVSLELIPSTGIDVAEFMPDEFMLFRNYPNPFNPSTTIQYYVPRDGYVEIKIYDFLGNEVKTLVSEHQSKQFYRVRWDGTNTKGNRIPSGMYFFRMVARSNQQTYIKTRKMILLQ